MTQTKVGWRPYVATTTSTSYLLDTYSGAAAAYSLRKLRTAYTGPAIRVRRSSDNTSQDIGFNTDGTLDTTALTTFVGSNNSAQYSEEFNNAYWTKTNTTIETNQTTAPDGTMTADLLSETTSENFHNLRNTTNLTFTSGTSWNMSVYVKKGPGATSPDTFALAFNGGEITGINAPWVLFNISTGVVVTSGNVSNDANFGSSITDVGNGWFRCAMWGTVTTTQGRPSIGAVRFTNNSNTLNNIYYSGKITSNMYVWGYQFSKALNDTSVLTTQPYTKTTATIAAGNGFVSIWYDQISSFNKTQNTATRQPVIVSSGFINTMNSKPSLKFTTSSNSSFDLSAGPTINEPTTIFTTFKLDKSYSTTSQYQIFGGPTYDNQAKFSISNNKYYLSNISTTNKGILSTATASSNPVITTTLFSSIDKLRVNSNEVISGDTGGFSSYSIYIGRGYLGLYFLGDISELIIYTSDKTSDFNDIESNINTYYTIY
jgi:hypothetical protein